MQVLLNRPWLDIDFGRELRVLSWSISRPGFVNTHRITWREVCDAELTESLHIRQWFRSELEQSGRSGAVGMLTSRDISAFVEAEAYCGDVHAHSVATVGLSNAERVGRRLPDGKQHSGTINIAVYLNIGLNDTALLEMMSVVAQARTLAVIEAGHELSTGIATGTGTDCIVVAAPAGSIPYAGLHTEQGEAVGKTVYEAVCAGVGEWLDTVR